MKRIITALFAVLVISACQSTEKRIENVSETFLHAYYTADYAAAAACCTPAFAEQLQAFGSDSQAELPEETQAKIKEALSRTSFEIISVELDEATASARVRYALSVPGAVMPVPKVLKLQVEGRTALVDGIE